MDEKEYEAIAKVMTNGIEQVAVYLPQLTPQQLEEDVKQVALLLSRQGNANELLGMASDGNLGNLLSVLYGIVDTNDIELNTAKILKK